MRVMAMMAAAAVLTGCSSAPQVQRLGTTTSNGLTSTTVMIPSFPPARGRLLSLPREGGGEFMYRFSDAVNASTGYMGEDRTLDMDGFFMDGGRILVMKMSINCMQPTYDVWLPVKAYGGGGNGDMEVVGQLTAAQLGIAGVPDDAMRATGQPYKPDSLPAMTRRLLCES